MITKGKIYKLQNWFESNQKLFAKKFKKKSEKKKEKEMIKEERAPGTAFGPRPKMAHDPSLPLSRSGTLSLSFSR
jgi:hypothetical protein